MVGKRGQVTVVRASWRPLDASKVIPGPWTDRKIFYGIGIVPYQLSADLQTPIDKLSVTKLGIDKTMENQITKARNKASAN